MEDLLPLPREIVKLISHLSRCEKCFNFENKIKTFSYKTASAYIGKTDWCDSSVNTIIGDYITVHIEQNNVYLKICNDSCGSHIYHYVCNDNTCGCHIEYQYIVTIDWFIYVLSHNIPITSDSINHTFEYGNHVDHDIYDNCDMSKKARLVFILKKILFKK